jgi:hypothetical protein
VRGDRGIKANVILPKPAQTKATEKKGHQLVIALACTYNNFWAPV